MVFLLTIIKIHYTTNNVNDASIAWGVITFIIYIINGGWMLALMGALVSFIVVWLLFSLSNYLESNLFLRILILVFSMGVMLIVLRYFWVLA